MAMPAVPSRIEFPSLLRVSGEDDHLLPRDYRRSKALPAIPGKSHAATGSPPTPVSNASSSDGDTIHASDHAALARSPASDGTDMRSLGSSLEQTYPLAPIDICYDIDTAALATEMALNILHDSFDDGMAALFQLPDATPRSKLLDTVPEGDESAISRRSTPSTAASLGHRIMRSLPLRPSPSQVSPRSRRWHQRRRSVRPYAPLDEHVVPQQQKSSGSAAYHAYAQSRVSNDAHLTASGADVTSLASQRKPRIADVASREHVDTEEHASKQPTSRFASAIKSVCSIRRSAGSFRRARVTPRNGSVPVAHASTTQGGRLFPSWTSFSTATWDRDPDEVPSSYRCRDSTSTRQDTARSRFTEWV